MDFLTDYPFVSAALIIVIGIPGGAVAAHYAAMTLEKLGELFVRGHKEVAAKPELPEYWREYMRR